MKITVKQIVNAVNGTLLSGSEEILVTSASVNSREIEKGALFVPIIGEKVDGHRFIDGAFENGAVASFVAESATLSEYAEGKAYIQVKDTLKALQALGSWYRDQFGMPVIGITGSVGKTTTKEMVGAALATKYNVIKTLGNMNSQVGLPLMMFHFEPEHEVAVIEMGMIRKNDGFGSNRNIRGIKRERCFSFGKDFKSRKQKSRESGTESSKRKRDCLQSEL